MVRRPIPITKHRTFNEILKEVRDINTLHIKRCPFWSKKPK